VAAVGSGFVRAAEWRRVREFTVGAAARQEPAALVLHGEAGAGKSTLWRAGVQSAADAGCRVLRSEPSASEADSAFVGLSDLLAGVLPLAGPDIPGPQREALEVALLLRPPAEQPAAAHAVGLAVLAALRSCLESGPVLVAIDDAQWLDAGSREALAFALRRIIAGPLSLLLTSRSEAPADPLTVGAPPLQHDWRDLLAAQPAAEEITLAPLDARQIQRLLPETATAAQARLVAQQSRGNPFWAREIWASRQAGDAPVPPLALEGSERLFRLLSPPAREAMATVAAAGRIAVSDTVAVLGHLEDPAAAVDEAVLADFLVETDSRLAAAHPLIGAAALDVMPPGRRAELYRRLAAASASPERHAHFAALAAGPGPDPQVADVLDAAATAAYARTANAAAAEFAVQAVTFTPESDAAATVHRQIRAAELLFRAGDIDGALAHLETLDTTSLDTADLERALPLLIDMVDLRRGPAAATRMVTAAVDAVGEDPRRRALVLALASDVTYGIHCGRRSAALQAIACAEAVGSAAAPTLHRALLNLVAAKVSGAEGLDAELLERAESLEPVAAVTPAYDTADLHRGLWSRFVEDLDTSRAALRRSIARARDASDDYSQWTFWHYLAATEELAGDYATAAAALAEGERLAAWYDWPTSPWSLEPRCELLIATGKLDEALTLAELAPDDAPSIIARFVGACVRGKVSDWRGDAAAAVRHFEQAAWCANQYDWTDPGIRSRLDPPLAEAYILVGRPQDADRIAGWLRKVGQQLDRPALIGDACRIDALAAAAAGDLDAAAESARAAVDAHERSPLRPELARSLLTLGRIERRRKARGRARAALRRAQNLAADMGHQTLLAQIEDELPRTAAERSGTELTDAERRVAGQIASGATNREAAEALFVSVRTVETHVRSIYRKLGVRTRSELRRTLASTPNV
jgi:DNA-binding CsgD family transcriptional regulator